MDKFQKAKEHFINHPEHEVYREHNGPNARTTLYYYWDHDWEEFDYHNELVKQMYFCWKSVSDIKIMNIIIK